MKAIVVDDMPGFTVNLEKILEIDGIELKVFNQPEKFLEFSKTKDFIEYTTIIVDYSMPNITGYDVYKRLYEIQKGHIGFNKILYSANLGQISEVENDYFKSLNIKLIKKPNINKLIDEIIGA